MRASRCNPFWGSVAVVAVTLSTIAGCSTSSDNSVPTADIGDTTTGAASSTTLAVEAATTATPTTLVTTTTEAMPDAAAWMRDVFSGDTDTVIKAAALAVPGSPAHSYAIFQASFNQLLIQEARPIGPQSVSLRGSAVEVCNTAGECALYDNFRADGPLFVDFTIDDTEVAGRLGIPGQPVTIGPLTARVTASYRTVSGGALIVIMEMSTTETVSTGLSGSNYVGPDGRPSPVAQSFGPSELLEGATAAAGAVFPATDPGGQIVFDAYTVSTNENLKFTLQVPFVAPT